MKIFEKNIKFAPAIVDQINLFRATTQQEDYLSQEYISIVAWATATACQHVELVNFIRTEIGDLSPSNKKLVVTASSRMAITNPYFMSRNIHPLQPGGSLTDLNMRPFQDLEISNETGYHFACIAISLINNGFVCFNSHLSSLKAASQSDKAIDQALRLVASISAIKQLMFNEQLLP